MKLDELAHAGRLYKELGDRITALESERRQVSKTITDELARRKATSIEHAGTVVTLSSRRIGYDVDELRARLRPGVFRAVTTLAVDPDALQEQVKAGKATSEDLQAAERRSRPFPKITLQAA